MSRVVTFGEIMGRFCTPGHQRFQQAMPGKLNVHFGGAEASVAGLIANWGGDVSYVTALPDNPLGRAVEANLRSLKIDVQSIVWKSESRLGLYFVEQGANQRSGQVIYDRADSAFSVTQASEYDWEQILADVSWLVVSGITPAVSENACNVIVELLEQAEKRNIQVACDVNYRSKLWRWDDRHDPKTLAASVMSEAVVPHVDLLVCGVADAIELLGVDQDSTIESIPSQLKELFPELSMLVMTRRESLSATHQRFGTTMFDLQSNRRFDAPAAGGHYDIADAVDRIGTGDAFLGALVFALSRESVVDLKQAVALATAAGCLAHSIEGDFPLIDLQETRELTQHQSIRIKR